ncbi:MAG: hypothetical protein H7144_00535 [Burkholderiales bacterium]|nr:hypothetical protein [Phycisphaerae bacterium]
MDAPKYDWSEWRSITLPTEHWEPGIYQVRLARDGTAIPINRLRGTDSMGLLTIGQTQSVEGRRKQFLKAATQGGGHSAGNLLNLILNYCQPDSCLSLDLVEYRFASVETKERAEREQALIVRSYILAHCEPPPLNSAIPDRYGEKHGAWEVPAPEST